MGRHRARARTRQRFFHPNRRPHTQFQTCSMAITQQPSAVCDYSSTFSCGLSVSLKRAKFTAHHRSYFSVSDPLLCAGSLVFYTPPIAPPAASLEQQSSTPPDALKLDSNNDPLKQFSQAEPPCTVQVKEVGVSSPTGGDSNEGKGASGDEEHRAWIPATTVSEENHVGNGVTAATDREHAEVKLNEDGKSELNKQTEALQQELEAAKQDFVRILSKSERNGCRAGGVRALSVVNGGTYSGSYTRHSAAARSTTLPLPPGWEERYSKSRNRKYYYNASTGGSSWTRPGSTAPSTTSSCGPSSPPSQPPSRPDSVASGVLQAEPSYGGHRRSSGEERETRFQVHKEMMFSQPQNRVQALEEDGATEDPGRAGRHSVQISLLEARVVS